MWRSGESSREANKINSWHGARRLLAGIFLFFGTALPASAGDYLVLGDIPYNPGDQVALFKQIQAAARVANFPFAVHYGDTKGGGESCDDPLLESRVKLITGLLPGKRTIITPGDNDWTDCDRPAAGGYDELERLTYFRGLLEKYAPDDTVLGITRQNVSFWENARWSHDDTMFSTIHLVGTDNGRANIGPKTDRKKAFDLVAARDAANVAWISKAFAAAETEGAKALVFVMQTDPYDFYNRDKADIACTEEIHDLCNPYKVVMDALKAASATGGKPVLLVHGSTDTMCLDKTYGGAVAPNLWRLNGPGDYWQSGNQGADPLVRDAAVVSIDHGKSEPFSFRLLLSGKSIPVGGC